jgi:hypothetical protein
MANFDFEQNKGKIARLYPDKKQLYFRFGGAGSVSAMPPPGGYYFIPLTHPNYHALVDLVYLSAERDWIVRARTEPALVAGHAEVIYLVVDFKP